MVAQRSLLLAAAGAVSVFAHPFHHAHNHAHQHARRQDMLQLTYVTFYQTQPAGPSGTAIVYTLSSPAWATVAATGAPQPVPVNATSAAVDATSAAVLTSSVVVTQPAVTSVPSVPASAPSSAAPSSAAEPSISVSLHAEAYPGTSTAAYSAPETSAAAPSTTSSSSSSNGASGAYVQYSGSPSSFPTTSEWLTFEEIFDASKGDASKGMISYGLTESDMSTLSSAIKAAASSTGVDARVVLAMAMQETRGVATTTGGGLIQATGSDGQPCDGSWSDAEAQLTCGLNGVYAACQKQFSQNDPWVALRCYNSGAAGTDSTNLNVLAAAGTASYVNDIANRLANGWTN